MRALLSFTKKEFVEALRTGKLYILSIVFVLFGIMNPAIAKLTPWLMDTMSDSLKDTGLTISDVHVDAITSWTQYTKNFPILILIFLLMFSTIFTYEYQRHTLINILTKGLSRYKVVLAKSILLYTLWTVGYWMFYGISYIYTDYYWNNSIAKNLGFSAFCLYILGIFLVSVLIMASTIFSTSTAVIFITGGITLLSYVLSFFEDLKFYLPTTLMDMNPLILNQSSLDDYVITIIITCFLIMIFTIVSFISFSKKSVS